MLMALKNWLKRRQLANRRRRFKPGETLSQFIAKDVVRVVEVISAERIEEGIITGRVRTTNLLYQIRLGVESDFGPPQQLRIDEIWQWSGQSWGGLADGTSLVDPEQSPRRETEIPSAGPDGMKEERTLETEVVRLFEKSHSIVSLDPGQSYILQALWDGDTTGWFLDITLLVIDDNAETKEHCIDTIRYGGDIRLFNGQVPPWPESQVAQQLAQKIGESVSCSLWFPSPQEPDDDNPSYAQRELAIRCADCQKLIMPPTSEFLPKDCCYPCHLRRGD